MYFLNDKHPEYEYCLYTQIDNALPFITELRYITTPEDLFRKIQEIEKKHNHYKQRFYIDNDFYDNKYSLNSGGIYYKFLRRNVTDWQEFNNFNDSSNAYKSRVIDILKYF